MLSLNYCPSDSFAGFRRGAVAASFSSSTGKDHLAALVQIARHPIRAAAEDLPLRRRFQKLKIRLCSRYRPTIDRTRIVSLRLLIPGRSAHMPRTISSITTPCLRRRVERFDRLLLQQVHSSSRRSSPAVSARACSVSRSISFSNSGAKRQTVRPTAAGRRPARLPLRRSGS